MILKFIEQEISRCDREIAQMETQPPVKPAYLTTLGIEDWKWERRALERARTLALAALAENPDGTPFFTDEEMEQLSEGASL